jgi:hypothetical protein
VALAIFERIEPRLSGDPSLVLIPGGGGLVEAVRVAVGLSREVVLLLAPRQCAGGEVRPARQEVVEALAALAEDPPAARRLLERGLGEAWWEDLNSLHRALRLNGLAWAVAGPVQDLPAPSAEFTLPGLAEPPVIGALARARLILLGPGDPAINLAPVLSAPGVRGAVLGSRGLRLCVGSEAEQAVVAAWLGAPTPAAPPARWQSEVQARLLQQAAGQVKSVRAYDVRA